MSRASIYRILDELERLGHVQRLSTGHAMARYERVHDPTGHHHHLVCEDCGAVTPFSDERLERAIAAASERVPLAGLRARDRAARPLSRMRASSEP